MLTMGAFDNLKLKCVYNNGKINIDLRDMRYYVYVIVNRKREIYYVGLSGCLHKRIYSHIKNNKTGLDDINDCFVYILEQVFYEYQMREMEQIWINWFKHNTNCCNIERCSYKIRSGKINVLSIINSKYEQFVLNSTIYPIKLLPIYKTETCETEYEYDRDQPFY